MPKEKIIETAEPEKKETFGQQVARVHAQNSGKLVQTIGETTSEMAKEYIRSMEKMVNDHQHYREPYYIMEIIKPDGLLEGVIKMVHIARKSRPRPEWGIALYKVDNQKGTLTYEWGLPLHREAVIVMENPGGWDPKIVEDITAFVEKRLI